MAEDSTRIAVKHCPLSLLLIAGMIVAAPVSGASDAGFRCISDVASYSAREKMGSGDFSPNVYWRDVVLKPTSIGYGPSGNREDEVTIIDGKVFMRHPTANGGIAVNNQADPDQGLAMLQVASPTAWREANTLDAVSSFDDLDFVLEDQAEEMGCEDDVLLPFKIIGHADSVTWSLDTQPRHLVQDTKDQDVVIVGLYNRNQREKYFMVRGYNLHAHVLMKGIGKAGHLRSLELNDGARLYLPR